MATQYNSSIAREDLRLCFDAASIKSYSGSAPWVDLSRSSTNGTSTNFPGYLSSNNGILTFSRAQWVDFGVPNIGNKITVEMWAKVTGTSTDTLLFGFNLHSLYINPTGSMGYSTGVGDLHGITPGTFSALGINGNWKHMVFVMNADVSYTNNKMYINTSGQVLAKHAAGTENATYRNFNAGTGRLAGWRYAAGNHPPLQCAVFRIYNKELSQTEIDQNFNATRHRFNL